jgi:two-component sensor histidine kinase
MAELDHRVRNTLATVQSMLGLSKAHVTSTKDFVEGVQGRIDALALAHGLLAKTHWQGASLRELIETELRPYRAGGVHIEGGDLLLQPKAAEMFALLLHELATNAAKHGALSNDSGSVTVAWRIERQDADAQLILTWAEAGGPRVAEKLRRGFGTRLIESGLSRGFRARTELAFRPEGAHCRIVIPLSRVAASDSSVAVLPEPAIADSVSARRSSDCSGARVLVVEDDTLIGLDMAESLAALGVTVVGPVAEIGPAIELVRQNQLNAALLDVNLGEERVYPVADYLARRGVPFAFLTGYDVSSVVPARFRTAPALQKPVSRKALAAMVQQLVK